jgi:hypothetical protein
MWLKIWPLVLMWYKIFKIIQIISIDKHSSFFCHWQKIFLTLTPCPNVIQLFKPFKKLQMTNAPTYFVIYNLKSFVTSTPCPNSIQLFKPFKKMAKYKHSSLFCHWQKKQFCNIDTWDCIFSRVRPFYEWAMSDPDS